MLNNYTGQTIDLTNNTNPIQQTMRHLRYQYIKKIWTCNVDSCITSKDILIWFTLFKANNWYTYLLSTDPFQVGLREHPNTWGTLRLGKDNGVFAKTHGSRLEAIAINSYWLYTVYSNLVTVPKAWGEKWKYPLVSRVAWKSMWMEWPIFRYSNTFYNKITFKIKLKILITKGKTKICKCMNK